MGATPPMIATLADCGRHVLVIYRWQSSTKPNMGGLDVMHDDPRRR